MSMWISPPLLSSICFYINITLLLLQYTHTHTHTHTAILINTGASWRNSVLGDFVPHPSTVTRSFQEYVNLSLGSKLNCRGKVKQLVWCHTDSKWQIQALSPEWADSQASAPRGPQGGLCARVLGHKQRGSGSLRSSPFPGGTLPPFPIDLAIPWPSQPLESYHII